MLLGSLEYAEIAMPLDVYRHRTLRDAPIPPLCTCLIAYRNRSAVRQVLLRAAVGLAVESATQAHRRGLLRQTDQEYVHAELLAQATRARAQHASTHAYPESTEEEQGLNAPDHVAEGGRRRSKADHGIEGGRRWSKADHTVEGARAFQPDAHDALLEPIPEPLRVLPLPEEYYCPGVRHSVDSPATWRTPWAWSHYPCKAVHAHGGWRAMLERRPRPSSLGRPTPPISGSHSTRLVWTLARVDSWVEEESGDAGSASGDAGSGSAGINASTRWLAHF